VVGFAAETERVEEYARAKLERKRIDMIAANKVGSDCGFEREDNALLLLWPDGREELAQADKRELARQLVARIAQLRAAHAGSKT
jgi:phosphopantothenoylcysteine decarboxylase/phosphopantothenate--cysteine ligase